MAKRCKECGRDIGGESDDHQYVGEGRLATSICNLALLSDGRRVHVSRIDSDDADVRQQILNGEVKVTRRLQKKRGLNEKKVRA